MTRNEVVFYGTQYIRKSRALRADWPHTDISEENGKNDTDCSFTTSLARWMQLCDKKNVETI